MNGGVENTMLLIPYPIPLCPSCVLVYILDVTTLSPSYFTSSLSIIPSFCLCPLCNFNAIHSISLYCIMIYMYLSLTSNISNVPILRIPTHPSPPISSLHSITSSSSVYPNPPPPFLSSLCPSILHSSPSSPITKLLYHHYPPLSYFLSNPPPHSLSNTPPLSSRSTQPIKNNHPANPQCNPLSPSK